MGEGSSSSSSSSSTSSSTTPSTSQPINLPPLRPLSRVEPPPLPEQARYILNRPAPIEGECLVCYEGDSAPPTPCCGKPLCNNCLRQWMEGRRITCPHCRERLPNEVIVTNQEASDALLADPDFQRRIHALRITVLFIKKCFKRILCDVN